MELARGRRAPYVQVGEWILLANISRNAKLLYQFLASHINQERRTGEVWPSRATLAALLGYTKASSVDPFIKELVKLGAIDLVRRKRGDGGDDSHLYVVHETPPDGYQGLLSLQDFYASRKQDRGGTETGTPPSTEMGTGGVPKRGHELNEKNQTKKNQQTHTPPRASRAESEVGSFDEWYKAYPKKKEPGAARAAYAKALKKAANDEKVRSGQITAEQLLLAAAQAYAEDPERQACHDRYTKYPATWLNKECWLDERSVYRSMPVRSGGLVEVNGVMVTQRNADAFALIAKMEAAEALGAPREPDPEAALWAEIEAAQKAPKRLALNGVVR